MTHFIALGTPLTLGDVVSKHRPVEPLRSTHPVIAQLTVGVAPHDLTARELVLSVLPELWSLGHQDAVATQGNIEHRRPVGRPDRSVLREDVFPTDDPYCYLFSNLHGSLFGQQQYMRRALVFNAEAVCPIANDGTLPVNLCSERGSCRLVEHLGLNHK